jgi:UDP-N-acetylglucosamine 2-epimerase (non-hydrolysing)
MIHIVLGTKAQLVKMAPVMVRLRERGAPYRLVHTGQHQRTMDEMLEEFHLPAPDVVLHRGRDVVSLPQMALFAAKLLVRGLFARRAIFGDDRHGLVLVHGDTLSTLVGALLGRVAGLRVGHVESGLRSGDWFHPFPEEITRLLVARLSHILYCPGAWAIDNVARLAAEKIDTGANTLADTLALASSHVRRTDHVPEEAFALVSLHRYENIFDRARLARLVGLVEEIAEERRLLFILHPPTERRLQRTGLYARLAANSRIELRPRYTYFDFVALLLRADFVVTDGGSIQEESSYIGIPCLLLRRATERREGIGANVVISHYDENVIRSFARDAAGYRREPVADAGGAAAIIAESAQRYTAAQAVGGEGASEGGSR